MKPLAWEINTNHPPDLIVQSLGGIPTYLDADSVDPIYRQFEEKSRTGWWPELPSVGWTFTADDVLIHPQQGPATPVARAAHLGERILVYPAGWCCVVQLDGSYTIARVG